MPVLLYFSRTIVIYNKYYLETNQAKKIEFEYKKEVELEKLFASIEESFA